MSKPDPKDAGARPDPVDMRQAMVDYIRAVHTAYLSAAAGQPPAVRGRLGLLAGDLTVAAAGVRNLHVIATTEALAPPSGREVAVQDEAGDLRWTVRFFDPVVLPPLGLIDETEQRPASAEVRRVLGISTHLYHLIVQPGGTLTTHHAGHAGAGLAMDHVADARDFEAIRAHAPGREGLVDEFEGAARAGLHRAQALLAREIAGDDPTVAEVARQPTSDPAALRRAVLAAVRSAAQPPAATPIEVRRG